MKTKNFVLSGILGVALAGFVLTGCHKSATTSSDTDYQAAQDEANASFAANDSKSVSDAAIGTATHSVSSFSTYYSSTCTITWAKDSSAADTVTINFGNAPVQCGDLKWRQGEIIVYWPRTAGRFWWQAYFDSANTVTQTFKGYYVGSLKSAMNGVAGTRTWTNEGHNTAGYENWNFTANLTITYPSGGGTATWNSVRYNVLQNIGGTWYYQIKGSANGTSKNGVGYTLSIEDANPLYVTAWPWWLGGCAYIESGVIDINRTT